MKPGAEKTVDRLRPSGREFLPAAILAAIASAFPYSAASCANTPMVNSSSARTAEREVLDVVRSWNNTFAKNDVERYFGYVDPEITVLTPANPYRIEGLDQDREEFEFSLASGKTRVNLFQMMQPKVQLAGDAAVVTYFWRGALGPADSASMAHFKETDVFVRRAEGWKLLHVHLSHAVP